MNCFISWQKSASIPFCIIQGGREEVFTAQSPAGLYTDTAGRQKHSQTGLDDEETDEEEEEEMCQIRCFGPSGWTQLLSSSSVAVSTSQDFDDNATITAF